MNFVKCFLRTAVEDGEEQTFICVEEISDDGLSGGLGVYTVSEALQSEYPEVVALAQSL